MSEERYDAILENLREAIRRSGMKQRVIAERCGMTPNQLSARLCKRQKLTVSDVPLLCAAVGIKPNELFGMSV